MAPPTFTVVMPAYNTAETIGDAVRSVLGQTRSDFELIVVDDGSTDDTAGVVQAFTQDPRVRMLAQENAGAAAARNAGLGQASGRFVSFIDSDDRWLPSYLELMLAALEQTPDAGFAYTDAWTVDPRTGRVGAATAMQWQRPPPVPPATAQELLLELLERNFIYTAVTAPRTVFERVGQFDPSLKAAIDYEMWLRMAAHGYVAVRPPGLLAVYSRDRAGSISANRTVVVRSLVGIYDRFGADSAMSPQVRQVAGRRAGTVRAELAALEGAGGLDSVWRRRVRPVLVRSRNTIFHRDGWLDSPPAELVEAFPDLVLGNRRGGP
jgi:glycosyltransferase involved in cell wall biosynthesis